MMLLFYFILNERHLTQLSGEALNHPCVNMPEREQGSYVITSASVGRHTQS